MGRQRWGGCECIQEGSQARKSPAHSQQSSKGSWLSHSDDGFEADTNVIAPGAVRHFDTVNLYNGASVSNEQKEILDGLPSIWTNWFSPPKRIMQHVFSLAFSTHRSQEHTHRCT